MSADLTGNKIRLTYPRLVQKSGSNYYDGVGNLLDLGGGGIDTGSFATTGSNTFIGDQTITGSVEITGNVTASALASSYIDFDGTTPAYANGRLFYDSANGALGFYNEEQDVTLQIGQEFWIYGKNNSGQVLANGTPVRISGANGANMLFAPAIAEDHTTASVYDNHLIGVLTHEVGINGFGYITVEGVVRDVDTSDFTAGDILYLQTGSGGFRNTPPPFPYDIVQIGFVKRVQSQNGEVFVKVQEPVHFGNISGLSGSASEPGDLWIYQANNAWSPGKTLSGSYTISNGGLTADSFTGSLQGNASSANELHSPDGILDTRIYTTGPAELTLSTGENDQVTLTNAKLTVGVDLEANNVSTADVDATGNIEALGYVSASYLIGDGSGITNLPGGNNYITFNGNANISNVAQDRYFGFGGEAVDVSSPVVYTLALQPANGTVDKVAIRTQLAAGFTTVKVWVNGVAVGSQTHTFGTNDSQIFDFSAYSVTAGDTLGVSVNFTSSGGDCMCTVLVNAS